MAGNDWTGTVAKGCDCSWPYSITNYFYLYGSAVAGVDYDIDGPQVSFYTVAPPVTGYSGILVAGLPRNNYGALNATFTVHTYPRQLQRGSVQIIFIQYNKCPFPFLYTGSGPAGGPDGTPLQCTNGFTLNILDPSLPELVNPMMTTNGFQATILGSIFDEVATLFATTNVTDWTNLGQVLLTNGVGSFMDSGYTKVQSKLFTAVIGNLQGDPIYVTNIGNAFFKYNLTNNTPTNGTTNSGGPGLP